MRVRERDALATAVLASLLLHVVLLGALPGRRETQRSLAPAPILARVLPEQSPQERAALLQQSTPSRARSSPPKRSAPLVNAPEPAQELSKTLSEPSPSVALASGTTAKPEPVTLPPALPAANAGTIAQYRLAIISFAKGFNRYPRIAVENNWQGRAELRVTLGADGVIASLYLRDGSGHEILDRQALDMIGQAARQVAMPAALRGREFVIDIPVIFSLKEAER